MRTVCAVALLLTPALHAQYSGLSTNNDGSAVYFASSLAMRGTNQYLWGKIFRNDYTGAVLVSQRAPNYPAFPTNSYLLSAPQVSSDGKLLLYLGVNPCGGGSSCYYREHNATTLRDIGTGLETNVAANAVMSRNSRYLLGFDSGNIFGPSYRLIDRDTSATVYAGNGSLSSAAIAADGTTAAVFNGASNSGGNPDATPRLRRSRRRDRRQRVHHRLPDGRGVPVLSQAPLRNRSPDQPHLPPRA